MALDFWTSLGYSTTVLDYFDSESGSPITINATGGRTGGPSLRFTAGDRFVTASLLTSSATKYSALACRMPTLPASDCIIHSLDDAGSTQVDYRVGSDGKLKVTRAGTILATSTNQIIFPNVYFQLQMKSVISNTGSIDVRLNGDTAGIAGLTGVTGDTQATANAVANGVKYRVSVSSGNVDFCHLLVSPDDWIGDARIDYLPPTGAGNYSQWTPSSGANYTTVDEIGSPNTADYNASQTVGNKDSFTHGTIPSTATPIAVCPVMLHNKQDAGAAQDKFLMRQGGVDYNPGGAFNPPFGSNQYVKEAYMQDPTATDWTPTTVNAVEFGYERTA